MTAIVLFGLVVVGAVTMWAIRNVHVRRPDPPPGVWRE